MGIAPLGGCAGEDQPIRACNAAQRTERGPKYGREIARRSVGVCWRLKGFGVRVNSNSSTSDQCVYYCDSFLIAPCALDHKVKIQIDYISSHGTRADCDQQMLRTATSILSQRLTEPIFITSG